MASITVSTPSSSTVWDAGESHTISWSKFPSSGTWGTFTIYLYKNNVFQTTIASNLPNTTTAYSWSIHGSTTPGADYEIQIVASYTSGGGGGM